MLQILTNGLKSMQRNIQRFIMILSSYFLIACEPAHDIEPKKMEVDSSLCQFQTHACEQDVNGNILSMQFDKKDAPSEKPIAMTLTFSKPVSDVQVVIEGRDMYMGVIPVSIKPIKNDNMTYLGSLIYGSCASGYMVWRAIITYKQDGTTHQVWFDFLADAPQLT